MATLFGTLKLSKNFDIDFIKLLFTKLRLGLKNFKIVYRYTPPIGCFRIDQVEKQSIFKNNENCDDQSHFSLPSSVGE